MFPAQQAINQAVRQPINQSNLPPIDIEDGRATASVFDCQLGKLNMKMNVKINIKMNVKINMKMDMKMNMNMKINMKMNKKMNMKINMKMK